MYTVHKDSNKAWLKEDAVMKEPNHLDYKIKNQYDEWVFKSDYAMMQYGDDYEAYSNHIASLSTIQIAPEYVDYWSEGATFELITLLEPTNKRSSYLIDKNTHASDGEIAYFENYATGKFICLLSKGESYHFKEACHQFLPKVVATNRSDLLEYIPCLYLPILDIAIPVQKDDEAALSGDEKDSIIYGLQEGADNWKLEYDNCRTILELLVKLKEVKDSGVITDFYLQAKSKAWEAAKEFLQKYQHH